MGDDFDDEDVSIPEMIRDLISSENLTQHAEELRRISDLDFTSLPEYEEAQRAIERYREASVNYYNQNRNGSRNS